MGETKSKAILRFQRIQGVAPLETTTLDEPLYRVVRLRYDSDGGRCGGAPDFACLSISGKRDSGNEDKLLAIVLIGKEEGIKGYWKGNLPQVIRVIPYSAVQLFAMTLTRQRVIGFWKTRCWSLCWHDIYLCGVLPVMLQMRLITYLLDVLRLRLAVEPGYRKMSEIALTMLREEGFASFYYGLGPSLIGIAPYIAVNFCIFDLVNADERFTLQPKDSTIATNSYNVSHCCYYHLISVRHSEKTNADERFTLQIGLGSHSRLEHKVGTAFTFGYVPTIRIIERDGIIGLYRGFVPKVLKNLPNSSISLTTFDIVKRLLSASEKEFQKIVDENFRKDKDETGVEESRSS
ncbi:putative envelope ADP,ATP carrier protein [Hibiscus syriacus]|uniref:Envelope ADP,ATP carrier protein n=1 Tax=Hibiscus syriacus TaxID=106335 RepID=A0A6A3B5Z5_HIBSY|nr:putative envelope ADP,ATP carrier protein [Hibiscus syriacus]